MTKLLEVSGLDAKYGDAEVLHGVSLYQEESEIVAIIGANGAGKTTLLKCLMGMHNGHGSVRLNGQELSGLSPYKRAKLGLGMVPEGRGTLNGLSVLDNLRVAALSHPRSARNDEIAYWLDTFPRLKDRTGAFAQTLSGGEQQMLAIARALLPSPKLLLLDEPSMGLAPNICDILFTRLAEINSARGTSVLIVEQDVSRVLNVSDRAYILRAGAIVREAASEELLADDSVRRAYLGVS